MDAAAYVQREVYRPDPAGEHSFAIGGSHRPVRLLIGPTSAERIRRLELQVTLLCAAMDLRVPDTEELIPQEVFDLARDGQRVQAARVLRGRGFSLVAGSRIVDAISRQPVR